MKPKLNENIFRPNDIRGIYGKDITEDLAEKIGKAFGSLLGRKKSVVVGRDARLSSKSLRDALVKGLTFAGCDVFDIGLTTTPAFYFALYRYKFSAGIMITASHNPPEWNGFHIYEGIDPVIAQEKIEKLKEIITKEKFKEAKTKGKVEPRKILQDYINFLSSKVKIKRKMKIAVDCSNSCAALVVPKLLKKLDQRVVVLNSRIDGRFPAHGPEPKEENLGELKEKVIEAKADFGVSFDGDADRAVFVDDKGRVLAGDRAALVILQDLFSKKNSKKILDEVNCSSAVEDFIRSRAGVLITGKRGRGFMQQMMRKEGIDFGFEKSSHFYFSELEGFDDAAFATLKVAEILSRSEKSFSQIVDSIPWYPGKEEDFACNDEIKQKIVDSVKKEIIKLGLKTSEIDGIKAFNQDGWFLIRASITEPLIRLTAEARDEEVLKKILGLARNILKKEMNKYMFS